MKKLHIIAFISSAVLCAMHNVADAKNSRAHTTAASQNVSGAVRPALLHQIFPLGEVESYLKSEVAEFAIEIPQEVRKYLACKLQGEKVTGLSVSLSPNIGSLFSGQKFSFEMAHLSEFGQKRRQTFEAQLDWEGLNAPHAYTLIIAVLIGTEREFFDTDNEILLEGGVQTTFPLPHSALSMSEVTARCAQSTGRLAMWCISLGSHSAANFLETGSLTLQK